MIYEYEGKKHRIPDAELKHLQNSMGVSEAEAIWIWLEDEGIVDNEEQNALDQKAKENRITATIHQAKAFNPNKTQRERVKKPDPTKEGAVTAIAEALAENTDFVKVINEGKLIVFKIGDEHFKVDVTRYTKKGLEKLRSEGNYDKYFP